jgi:hypothetical protein
METKEYIVHAVCRPPEFAGLWDGPAWRAVPAAELAAFRPESSRHRPQTQIKLLHDASGLHGLFQVRDRYVRCVRSGFQEPVYKDSCVEFFVQPDDGGGYFNFEFNCGGALLAGYITDPVRTPTGFRGSRCLTEQDVRPVRIFHSLPGVVDPERQRETLWQIEFFIPFALLKTYAGTLNLDDGACWRGNFYKCADESSHPHWAAWSPVDELNFHLPRCFGVLRFSSQTAER